MQAEKALVVIAVASIVVIGFAVGFTFLTFDEGSIEEDVDLKSRGIQLPDWNLMLSNESIISLHSLRSRFVVIDLMATWCGACETQNENFKTLYNNMSKSIYLISLTVDKDETAAMMAAYMEDKNLPWPHGLDSQSVFTSYFNVQYIPSIVIIDKEGYVRWYHVGLWSENDMAETLALLMG
ncbi:MAG: TlpA family protein disulfide reductase [Promethearchaeota archaeon]